MNPKASEWLPAPPTAAAEREERSPGSDPAAAEILNNVRSLLRALRVGTRTCERTTGLSLAQLYVLKRLAERPALSLGELAERTATHLSSVSVVVSRLVERQLVTREQDPADRRRTRIDLTDAGRAVVANAPETISEHLVSGIERMREDERAALAALMHEWLELAGVDLSTAPMFFE